MRSFGARKRQRPFGHINHYRGTCTVNTECSTRVARFELTLASPLGPQRVETRCDLPTICYLTEIYLLNSNPNSKKNGKSSVSFLDAALVICSHILNMFMFFDTGSRYRDHLRKIFTFERQRLRVTRRPQKSRHLPSEEADSNRLYNVPIVE
jgi:hypothetical protein